MSTLIDYLPLAATAFAVPQFVPQIIRLARTGDGTGVSCGWAALTSVNNAAWFAYFAMSGYFVALMPSACATVLAAAIAALLAGRLESRRRPAAAIAGWSTVLVAGGLLAGRVGLGTLLTAAFAVQVLPAIRAAYATGRPTGISRATWLLILCELACWLVYGIHASDPRLIVLGATGVGASVLILNRTRARSAPRAPVSNLLERVAPAPGSPARRR